MRTSLRAVLATSILLGACSTATTPASVAPTLSGAPVASLEPTDAPTAEGSATPEPVPSLSGDLASLMPTEIGGHTMTFEPASDPGQSFLILWFEEQTARDLLDSLGKTADDVDVVYTYASDPEEQIRVTAYRVAGADGAALLQGFVDNYVEQLAAGSYVAVPTSLGGKDVIAFGSEDAPPDTIPNYFYNAGDIVFQVDGNRSELIEEALSKLP